MDTSNNSQSCLLAIKQAQALLVRKLANKA